MCTIKSVILLCFVESNESSFFVFKKYNTFYLKVEVKSVSIYFLKEPNEWMRDQARWKNQL